jgi:hypothetical protein
MYDNMSVSGYRVVTQYRVVPEHKVVYVQRAASTSRIVSENRTLSGNWLVPKNKPLSTVGKGLCQRAAWSTNRMVSGNMAVLEQRGLSEKKEISEKTQKRDI